MDIETVEVGARLAIGVTPEGNIELAVQSGVLNIGFLTGPDGAVELANNLLNVAASLKGDADAIVTDIRQGRYS